MIPPSSRMSAVSYAIRRVVAEAHKAEAAGKRIHYLNTGDPVAFGFATPAHMVEAVHKSLRDGENGYGPSVGLLAAREAVAAENTSRGWPVSADRVLLTSGSSEGIDFVLTALADAGDEVLVPLPVYPLYTAILHKIGAREVYYRTDPANGWQPDPNEIGRLITPRTKALVVNDPNNPTGAAYSPSVRRELLHVADRHNVPVIADEIYQDVAFNGPVAPIASLDPEAPVISLSGLSKGYLAPGWRTGWLVVGGGDRLKDVHAAMPPGKTDADFIIDLVHATGVLCVQGSGFGMDPAAGYFRMVTLAPPSQLNEIWDLIAGFVGGYR
jgi:alanine-synthesizing transaminase